MQRFTGMEYLKIDIANSFGLDKKTWNQRIAWFDANELLLVQGSWDEVVAIGNQAEEPAQFIAGVNAYRTALIGEPTGYLCGLDATASGIQLLSVLSGCKDSASTCNLTPTGSREDVYTTVHEEMNELLKTRTQFDRKPVKQAIMTHFYGSKAAPRNTFGVDTPELAAFYQTIETLLPGANMLNYDLLSLWQPDALSHDWTVPDGFDVKVKVMSPIEHGFTFLGNAYAVIEHVNQPQESGLSLGANIIHSIDGMVVREMSRRCDFDIDKIAEFSNLMDGTEQGHICTYRSKDFALLRLLELVDQTGFMSAVIFEYLDLSNLGHLSPMHRLQVVNLLGSMPVVPFSLIAIHDCFKFLAGNGNAVREQYINILAELADSSTLSWIATQITGKKENVTKRSSNLSDLIRQSDYALS